jgi:hypothetical protein
MLHVAGDLCSHPMPGATASGRVLFPQTTSSAAAQLSPSSSSSHRRDPHGQDPHRESKICSSTRPCEAFALVSVSHPMPGATARGRFAMAPMRKQAMRLVAAVALIRLRRTSCCERGDTDHRAQNTKQQRQQQVKRVEWRIELQAAFLYVSQAQCKSIMAKEDNSGFLATQGASGSAGSTCCKPIQQPHSPHRPGIQGLQTCNRRDAQRLSAIRLSNNVVCAG